MNTAYAKGRWARANGRQKECNPHPHMTSKWAWWLAGWNDRDMEAS